MPYTLLPDDAPTGKYTLLPDEPSSDAKPIRLSDTLNGIPAVMGLSAGTALNAGVGAAGLFSDIGSTLLAPFDKATGALGLHKYGIGRDDRRGDSNAALNQLGDSNSTEAKLARMGTAAAVTWPIGGALGEVASSIPGLANTAIPAALESGGFSLGGAKLPWYLNAPTRVLGGAINGGSAAGLINPKDAATGATIGAAFPMAVRSIGSLGSYIKSAAYDPFFRPDNVLSSVVGNAVGEQNIGNVLSRLSEKAKTPGVTFTAAQATEDPALAAMEDALSSMNSGGALNRQGATNRAALADTLRGIGQDDAAIVAAAKTRNAAVESLYDAAKSKVVAGSPELEGILNTPAGKTAVAMANTKFANIQKAAPAAGNYSGEWLHEVKLALDKLSGLNPQNAADASALSGINEVKSSFNNWLDKSIGEYGAAKTTFADLSKPINQMQIGNYLAGKLIPATSGDIPSTLNAASLAKALQNPDEAAQAATGFNRARMAATMDPSQLQAIEGVNSDASRIAETVKRGMGVSSPTARRLAQGEYIGSYLKDTHPMTASLLDMIGSIPGLNIATKGTTKLGSLAASGLNNKIGTELEGLLGSNPQELERLLRLFQARKYMVYNPTMLEKIGANPATRAAINGLLESQ